MFTPIRQHKLMDTHYYRKHFYRRSKCICGGGLDIYASTNQHLYLWVHGHRHKCIYAGSCLERLSGQNDFTFQQVSTSNHTIFNTTPTFFRAYTSRGSKRRYLASHVSSLPSHLRITSCLSKICYSFDISFPNLTLYV